MKLASVFASALVGQSFASFADIKAQAEAMVANLTDGDNRVFSGSITSTLENISEYGCWCYFDDDHGRGKSQPADSIDGACKVLHDGYDCAILDAENAGTSCTPWEVAYNPAVGGTSLSIAEGCALANTEACAANACTIEGTFVANLLAVLLAPGGGVNDGNKQSNGFDVPTNCVTKSGGNGGEKQCCGSYPNRFPFKTLGGDRGCCGDRTFNKNTLNCCPGDIVKFNC